MVIEKSGIKYHYTHIYRILRKWGFKQKVPRKVHVNTASPEFMVMEEVWNIAKRDLLILQYYQSFADLKNKISKYFRTKRFNLDMRNYLLRDVI